MANGNDMREVTPASRWTQGMPRDESAAPHGALDAREQALLARCLALRIPDREVRERLIAYATELEAELAAKEARAPRKPEPLRMATGPIIWQADGPAMALRKPMPVAHFSPKTRRLLLAGQLAIARAAAIRQRRMPIRGMFQSRTSSPPV